MSVGCAFCECLNFVNVFVYECAYCDVFVCVCVSMFVCTYVLLCVHIFLCVSNYALYTRASSFLTYSIFALFPSFSILPVTPSSQPCPRPFHPPAPPPLPLPVLAVYHGRPHHLRHRENCAFHPQLLPGGCCEGGGASI